MYTPRPAPVASALPAQPFFATAHARTALARERFFDDGQRPTGLVGDPVIQSWMRCHSARRSPAESIGFDPVTPTRLHSVLQRGRPLLSAAQAQLAQLEATLAGTGCRTILTDGDGVVVHTTPASGVAAPVLHAAARVGVNLSEGVVGTTAPGIVVRSGLACTVTGREHYFDACGGLRCAAAPIRDRRGRLAGVLDLTVEQREFGFDAGALVGLYAAAIENALLCLPGRDQGLLLRFQVSPLLLGTPMEALAGVDTQGRLSWMNGVAEHLLGGNGAIGRAVEEVFGLPLDALVARTRPEAAREPQRLASGLAVWLQAQLQDEVAEAVLAPAAVPSHAAPPPAPATLAEGNRRLVRDTLARCGGNVSRAARELGVSRGLLYRQLAAMRDTGH
jgi:transcriptional regulator of acetoin/glycerol metabolism